MKLNSSLKKHILDILIIWRRLVLWLADCFALFFSLTLVLQLYPHDVMLSKFVFTHLMLPVTTSVIMILTGTYKVILKHMPVGISANILISVMCSGLIITVLSALNILHFFSFSLIAVYSAFSFTALMLIRIIVLKYNEFKSSTRSTGDATLIYGAGLAGVQLLKLLKTDKDFMPIGFIDDELRLRGSIVDGLPVYPSQMMGELVKHKNVKNIVLAMSNTTTEKRREIVNKLRETSVQIKSVPTMNDLMKGKSLDQLLNLDVSTLLGRDTIAPEERLLTSSIKNLNICVTGAGGSIGSEIARQAIDNGAKALVLYEISEFALYKTEKDLIQHAEQSKHDVKIFSVLGSVQDQDRLLETFKMFNIDTVFHAAAYKHVPIVENNIIPGIANNVLGTLYAGRAAILANVSKFVLISTDKAVRPTNVMGASKRVAELCIHHLSAEIGNETIFSMVRFGNVLGSSGSVIPLFNEQIAKGGPITVTHPEVNRYFMMISEAASLVIQASSMAQGGEVFVLDMGKPVKIVDLAEKMIKLSGLTIRNDVCKSGDIEIQFSGLRPGEKLYEELLIGDAEIQTSHSKIRCATENSLGYSEMEQFLKSLYSALNNNDSETAKKLLSKVVEGYKATG